MKKQQIPIYIYIHIKLTDLFNCNAKARNKLLISGMVMK